VPRRAISHVGDGVASNRSNLVEGERPDEGFSGKFDATVVAILIQSTLRKTRNFTICINL
jgi:hypothetical protein